LDDDEYLEQMIPNAFRNRVCRRQQRTKIARLQTIPPTAGEAFYLHCLLAYRPCRRFEGLRTVNGIIYDTYHEAAVELGLFSDTNEGFYAMLEAVSSFYTPHQLRFLFSRIVLEGYLACPLWDRFCDDLCQDLIHSTRSVERGMDLSLQALANYFKESGKTLSDFGLPEPLHRSSEVVDELERYDRQCGILTQHAITSQLQMNKEQRNIFNDILHAVKRHINDPSFLPFPFFLEGHPGRGKTYLADTLSCKLRGEGHIVLIAGTSALAATLYEGGRTAHNLFKIPVTDVSPFFTFRCFIFSCI
jgi:hypothetical protein